MVKDPCRNGQRPKRTKDRFTCIMQARQLRPCKSIWENAVVDPFLKDFMQQNGPSCNSNPATFCNPSGTWGRIYPGQAIMFRSPTGFPLHLNPDDPLSPVELVGYGAVVSVSQTVNLSPPRGRSRTLVPRLGTLLLVRTLLSHEETLQLFESQAVVLNHWVDREFIKVHEMTNQIELIFAETFDHVLMRVLSYEVISVDLEQVIQTYPIATNFNCLEPIASDNGPHWPCAVLESEDPRDIDTLVAPYRVQCYSHLLEFDRQGLYQLRKICMKKTNMDLILFKASFSLFSSPPENNRSWIQAIRRHIFLSLKRFNKHNNNCDDEGGSRSRLNIACPFAAFAFLIKITVGKCENNDDYGFVWQNSKKSWTFSAKKQEILDFMLGIGWRSVEKRSASTYVSVTGEVDIIYTHVNPNRIQFVVNHVTIGALGGVQVHVNV